MSPDAGASEGRLIVVVGPSGSGKDTVIAWLRANLPPEAPVRFVKRTITRPLDAGGEDHEAMTPDEFDAATSDGQFCLTWEAHGLKYGIPADLVEHVGRGGIAVLNGSRHALGRLLAVFPAARIASIHVDAQERRRRLAVRGREDQDGIAGRIERHDGDLHQHRVDAVIDNSGPVEKAGQVLLSLVLREDGGSEALRALP